MNYFNKFGFISLKYINSDRKMTIIDKNGQKHRQVLFIKLLKMVLLIKDFHILQQPLSFLKMRHISKNI